MSSRKTARQERRTKNEINQVTETVIGCAFKVGNTLGAGFLEKVYENALVLELRKAGLAVQQQHAVGVYYDGTVVGNFIADLLVEECVLVELKAVRQVGNVQLAQCLNYLKATGLRVCLLLNFGRSKVQVKRVVWRF